MDKARKQELTAAIAEIGAKRESSLPRPLRPIGGLVMRLHPGNHVPALRPENDYGDRRLSGYSGPVAGIDHIVKVVHDHKAGRMPDEDHPLPPAA